MTQTHRGKDSEVEKNGAKEWGDAENVSGGQVTRSAVSSGDLNPC